MGPESTLTNTCERSCDIYSLGILIFAIFNNGKPLFECQNQPSVFRKNAEELRKWRGQLLGKLPEGLQDIVKLMLNTEPTVRPDPDQLSKVHAAQLVLPYTEYPLPMLKFEIHNEIIEYDANGRGGACRKHCF